MSTSASLEFLDRQILENPVAVEVVGNGLLWPISAGGRDCLGQQRAVVGRGTGGFGAAGVAIHHKAVGHDAVRGGIAVRGYGDRVTVAVLDCHRNSLFDTDGQTTQNCSLRGVLQDLNF